MARPTYTYDPSQIGEQGKDRMRFELGDTMVEGMEQTTFLSDEEYEAILAAYPTKWKKAKYLLIGSILHRFAYEVDEKVGPLSLSLHQRYEHLKALYDELEDEVTNSSVPSANPKAINGPHYFREGLHDNPNAGGTNTSLLKGGGRRFV